MSSVSKCRLELLENWNVDFFVRSICFSSFLDYHKGFLRSIFYFDFQKAFDPLCFYNCISIISPICLIKSLNFCQVFLTDGLKWLFRDNCSINLGDLYNRSGAEPWKQVSVVIKKKQNWYYKSFFCNFFSNGSKNIQLKNLRTSCTLMTIQNCFFLTLEIF